MKMEWEGNGMNDDDTVWRRKEATVPFGRSDSERTRRDCTSPVSQ